MIICDIQEKHLEQINQIQRASYPPALYDDIELFRKIVNSLKSICLCLVDTNGDDFAIRGYILGYPVRGDRQNFESGPEESGDNQAADDLQDTMYVHDLCIHPNFQRQGLGSQLLSTFEERVKNNSVLAVAVLEALPYWEHHGYSIVSKSSYHGEPGTRLIKYII